MSDTNANCDCLQMERGARQVHFLCNYDSQEISYVIENTPINK